MNWVELAKARGEITQVVPASVAAAFIDAQFISLWVQVAAGEDPTMLRAQSRLAFAGLTGVAFEA
ncbi:MAG: hypothetical protein ACJAZO_004307 [Myxococcota bacterium]